MLARVQTLVNLSVSFTSFVTKLASTRSSALICVKTIMTTLSPKAYACGHQRCLSQVSLELLNSLAHNLSSLHNEASFLSFK